MDNRVHFAPLLRRNAATAVDARRAARFLADWTWLLEAQLLKRKSY